MKREPLTRRVVVVVAVALWQPTLKAAAPCFLIFPDHRKNYSCVCSSLFVEDDSLDLREKCQASCRGCDQKSELWDLFDPRDQTHFAANRVFVHNETTDFSFVSHSWTHLN